ncbi:Arc family DNA-binding protein [Sinorhizobium fredii]|uniref:Arc family DNA-binding protein n=1 Tax=Rhizobium fredii TaxID=380 RepID=UPI0035116051
MTKKQLVKDQDKFIVRLPEGMRDRIKAKADRAGMSMNEAIVWCLEKEFPAPVTLEERLHDLADMVSMLTDSKDTYAGVVNLIAEIEETLDKITSGKIPTEPSFRHMVRDRVDYWREMELDNWREQNESPFQHEEPPFSGDGDPFADTPSEGDKD